MSLSRHSANALAARKQMLRQRSMVLRHTLSVQASGAVAPVTGAVDRIGRGVDWVKRHPGLVALAAVAVVAWRPRRLLGLAGRAQGLWLGWQRWQPAVAQAYGMWLTLQGGRPPEAAHDVATSDLNGPLNE